MSASLTITITRGRRYQRAAPCPDWIAMLRRTLVSRLVVGLMALCLPPSLAAQETTQAVVDSHKFTQARLKLAQQQNRLILVETYADWCAPCRIQAPIVARLRLERRYRGLILLRLDENTPRDAWQRLGLAGFGQFIAFRGKRELGRGSPMTESEMRELLSE